MPSASWDADGQARRALQVIVADPDLGPGVLSRPQVMANVLKDLLPDSPREASVLVGAAEADLPGMLRGNLSHGLDPQTAVRLAAATLAGRVPFALEACDWVAGELAIALGIDPALIAKPHPQAGATSLDTVVTGGAGAGYPAPGPAPPGYALARSLCRSKFGFGPVTCGFSAGQAACVYSLVRPPRTGLRWIRAAGPAGRDVDRHLY